MVAVSLDVPVSPSRSPRRRHTAAASAEEADATDGAELLKDEKLRSDEVGGKTGGTGADELENVGAVVSGMESIELGSSELTGGDSLIDVTVASPPVQQTKTRARTGKIGPPLPPHPPED